MVLNTLFDLAKDKLQNAQKVAKDSMEKLKREVREKYLRIDSISNKIYLSDEAFVLAVKLLIKFYAEDLAVQIEPKPDGFLFTCEVKKVGKVVALLDLYKISYKDGKILLEVTTPTGITVKDRPVVSYVLSFMAPLFTGSSLGKSLFDEKLKGITWDGNTAFISMDIQEKLPAEGSESARDFNFTSQVSRENSWLRFEFENKESTEKFYALLQENVMALLKEKFSTMMGKIH